jgi:hypothetical protein
MGKRFAHLLSGVLLLIVAGYFILRTTNEWKALWQREVSAAVREMEAPASDSGDKDENDVTAAARLKLYGVLNQSSAATPEASAAAPPRQVSPSALDHVNPAPNGAPTRLLHGRFSVRSYQAFAFEIPAHATHPRLHGTFKSYTKDPGPGLGSAATVDVLLLKQEEFSAFAARGLGTASFSVTDSEGSDIDWVLDPVFRNPQKYYLVFRNSSGNSRVKGIAADFTISFE